MRLFLLITAISIAYVVYEMALVGAQHATKLAGIAY